MYSLTTRLLDAEIRRAGPGYMGCWPNGRSPARRSKNYNRLDFAVIGPPIDEVSRILPMSHSVEQDVLLSASFADTVNSGVRRHLGSVGRYALRGVAQPQELFTVEPGFEIPSARGK